MTRNKIIQISAWSRTFALTLVLWLAFLGGIFSSINPTSPIHGTSALKTLLAIFILIWIAPPSVYSLVLKTWNKITPLKDKPTFIENEIVYILSVLFGVPIFAAIFLKVGHNDIPFFMLILLAAALPGSLGTYLFQRLNKETILASSDEVVESDDLEENDVQGFNPATLTILAYLTASSIFAVTLALSVLFIVFLRIGFQPDKLIPITVSILTLCGSTVLLLTIFGHAILPLGMKIKTTFNVIPGETRGSIASTWVLGFMAIVTVFVVIFGGLRPPSSVNAFITSWHLWVTYALFIISSYVGGLTLKSFYTPKPLSTVFA